MWTVAVLAVTAACEPDPCLHATGDATLEVGTGQQAFAPLHDGDAVPYVRGLQGGTHVEGALRARELVVPADPALHEEQLPAVSFTVHDDAGTMIGGYQELPRIFALAGDELELVGELVIFLEDAAGRVGHTLELRATVSDQCGASASDARRFVLAAPTS